MGLRAGGALAGAGRGAPEGSRPGSGAQGGSIHSDCIAAVHNVPLRVLIRPLPSVLDPAKVQSLVDTIRVRPGEAGLGRIPGEGSGTRETFVPDSADLSIYCVTLSKWLGFPGPVSSFEQGAD